MKNVAQWEFTPSEVSDNNLEIFLTVSSRKHKIRTPPPTKVRGSWNFGVWGGGFLISVGGCPIREGVYFVGVGQFILHPFSHFEMQDFKNSKNICLWHLHFQYSHFQIYDRCRALSRY